MESDGEQSQKIWIITKVSQIADVKRSLQSYSQLDKSLKFLYGRSKIEAALKLVNDNLPEDCAAIPTNTSSKKTVIDAEFNGSLATTICLDKALVVTYALQIVDASTLPGTRSAQNKLGGNELALVVSRWLESLPQDVRSQLPYSIPELVSQGSWVYSIYGSLLTVSATLFKKDPWKHLLLDELAGQQHQLWQMACEALGTTHVGINAPIPLFSKGATGEQNTLRAPTGFTPLYGNFGSVDETPDREGFGRSYWVHVRQNGIEQVFAPLHTMFSRGNIKEKQRVLGFDSLKERPSQGVTAVDVYAGIGYFAFSYVKAGADLTLCWELNKWSVEGFRLAALKNKWKVRIVAEEEEYEHSRAENRLVMFNENNERALKRIEKLRSCIPPITHVNCGYLPRSELIWPDAVRILDPNFGGYVHAHENVAVADIEKRANELTSLFQNFWDDLHSRGSRSVSIRCSHVERVKSYAPGVIHCVFDMMIKPGQ